MQPAEEFTLDGAGGVVSGSAPHEDRARRLDRAFREHYPRIVGMLTRLAGDRGRAEDIAADVFCKLARRPALVENPADLTAWVYRVAMNAGLDAMRSNARRRRREEEAAMEQIRADAPAGALEGMLRQERCARVRDVLAALKPRDAQLLLLRSNGLAYRDLAETLGVAVGSVGTLLARAEAEFERRFRARYGDAL